MTGATNFWGEPNDRPAKVEGSCIARTINASVSQILAKYLADKHQALHLSTPTSTTLTSISTSLIHRLSEQEQEHSSQYVN